MRYPICEQYRPNHHSKVVDPLGRQKHPKRGDHDQRMMPTESIRMSTRSRLPHSPFQQSATVRQAQIHRELIDLARHHAGPMLFVPIMLLVVTQSMTTRTLATPKTHDTIPPPQLTAGHAFIKPLKCSPLNKKKFFSWSGTSEQTRKQLRILWGALSAPSKVAGVEHARASVQPSTTNLPNNERSLELYC